MTIDAPAGQSGALDRAGLRRVVTVLSVTVITSYGVLYYAFPVLLTSMAEDTGWSIAALTAAFSSGLIVAGLIGIRVGRILDRYGPRVVMTVGSLGSLPALALIAAAPNYPTFFAGWILAGVAMAGTLYPPAFAALTHWGGGRRVAALTTLTLVAGLASTIFAPLTAVLNAQLGWRDTYLVLAAILLLITGPAHWWGLRFPWASRERVTRRDPDGSATSIVTSRAFLLLAVSLSAASFTVYASVINLVPLLIERGLTPGLAALGLGLGGLGQVAGRLGYPALDAHTSVTGRTVIVIGGVAATTALLAMVSGPVSALLAVAVLLGVARGIFTLIQATAVSDRWGVAGFGRLNGVLSAPVLIAAAVAPFVGAALAGIAGGQAAAFFLMAIVSVLAAALALGARPATINPGPG